MLGETMMRTRLLVLWLSAALVLAGCSSILGEPPTPEPFNTPVPPTVSLAELAAIATADAAAPTAVSEPGSTPVAGTATAVPESTYTVQSGDVIDSITADGVVVERRRQDLSFTQDGTVVTLAVETKGPVKAGDLIAEQNLDDLADQVKQAQNDYDTAKAALDRSLAGVDIPIRQAEVDLAAAQDALQEARQPATAEELATARAALQSAQADLQLTRNAASEKKNQAEIVLNDAKKKLLDAQAEYGAAAQSDADNAEARLTEATTALRDAEQAVAKAQVEYDAARNDEIAQVQKSEASVTTAQAALDTLLKLPDPFAVKQAQRDVERARLTVDQARASANADPALTSAVKLAEEALKEIQTEADTRRLFAPFDGEIVSINIQAGDDVTAGQAVVTIINPDISADEHSIQIDQLEETDAARVRIGLPVSISFGSGTPISGEVGRIVKGREGGALPTIYIDLNQASNTGTAGEAASVVIEFRRKSGVLWLPPQAIRSGSQPFVLLENGERAEIQTGLSSAERVEIVSGLTEGQVVSAE
jgi:HlyD family secretion protein